MTIFRHFHFLVEINDFQHIDVDKSLFLDAKLQLASLKENEFTLDNIASFSLSSFDLYLQTNSGMYIF